MKVVVKISGKYVSPLDTPRVKEYAEIIDRLFSKGHRIAVVVGGGSTARLYIKEAPSSQSMKDFIGIEVARLNALLLALHMKNAYRRIPKSINEIVELLNINKVIVCGGLQPGQSTNAVSLILAEMLQAELVVNATTVDAVYDKPPHLPGARRLRRVTYDELWNILSGESWSQAPGRYDLFDMLSLQLAKRSKIPIAVVNGSNPDNVLKAVEEGVYGTLVVNE